MNRRIPALEAERFAPGKDFGQLVADGRAASAGLDAPLAWGGVLPPPSHQKRTPTVAPTSVGRALGSGWSTGEIAPRPWTQTGEAARRPRTTVLVEAASRRMD